MISAPCCWAQAAMSRSRDGDAMLACGREFALCGQGNGERLGVHAQVAKELEIIFEALVVAI